MNLGTKYRPARFSEVVGQQSIIRILLAACRKGDLATGYIFSGTRGVGKTTVARLMAKSANCENPIGGEPCCRCDSCAMVSRGNHMDVIELDAASNRGIGEIRALKETIGNAPMVGRMKVYIIDEAHMLTKEAFNALLKTLEEPPARVSFILATTEPHKILPTIRSRCQNYSFTGMTDEALVGRLREVCVSEDAGFEDEALAMIARKAKGSVRDGLSLLGQTLQGSGPDGLTVEAVRESLGLVPSDRMEELVTAVIAGDVGGCVGITRELLDKGVDVATVVDELAGFFRTMFLVDTSGQDVAKSVSGLADEDMRSLIDLCALSAPERNHLCWTMAMEARKGVGGSDDPWLDMQLLVANLAKSQDLLNVPADVADGNPDGIAAAKVKFGAS